MLPDSWPTLEMRRRSMSPMPPSRGIPSKLFYWLHFCIVFKILTSYTNVLTIPTLVSSRVSTLSTSVPCWGTGCRGPMSTSCMPTMASGSPRLLSSMWLALPPVSSLEPAQVLTNHMQDCIDQSDCRTPGRHLG